MYDLQKHKKDQDETAFHLLDSYLPVSTQLLLNADQAI